MKVFAVVECLPFYDGGDQVIDLYVDREMAEAHAETLRAKPDAEEIEVQEWSVIEREVSE